MRALAEHRRDNHSRHRIVRVRQVGGDASASVGNASVGAEVVLEKRAGSDAMLGVWGGLFILAVIVVAVTRD